MNRDTIAQIGKYLRWQDIRKFRLVSRVWNRGLRKCLFQDRCNWKRLSAKAPLTENFIWEFVTQINWYNLFGNRKVKLSKEFIDKVDRLVNPDQPLTWWDESRHFQFSHTALKF